jgi:integrase
MVDVENLSRKVVNHRISRIRRFFKWAVSEELAPPSILEGLRAVDGLRYGRTTAREAPPVKPVPQADVDAIVDAVSPQIATMIQLQRLAAMRPSEVVRMRGCDVDQSQEIWIYRPATKPVARPRSAGFSRSAVTGVTEALSRSRSRVVPLQSAGSREMAQ